MNLDYYRNFADECIRDTAPPCSSKCYFGLDVRKFVDKMKIEKYNNAYRTYRNAVLIPGVVCQLCDAPCGQSCVRAKRDGAIRLRELEAYCHEQCSKKPQKFNLPRREERIAVVGAGLSGLACALRMLSWGFSVTIFEKSSQAGGAALLEMDPQKCITEIENEFTVFQKADFVMNEEITDVEKLREEYAAVYIATGAKGSDFGLLDETYYAETLATRIPGVFLGGQRSKKEKNLMEAMVDGINVAEAINVFLKIGSMTYPTNKIGSTSGDDRFYGLTYDWEHTGTYKEEFDPKEEAQRCFSCNCSECFDVCPLMQSDKRYPQKMCVDVITTLKPNLSMRQAVRVIAGCTFCGKCEEVCPEHIDMGTCLNRARKDFYESGSFAEGFHEYWMQDLDFTLSEEAYLVWTPEKEKKSDVIFFPGCQLGASSPEYVKRAYEYMRKTTENPTLYLGCCGIPADWAGNEKRQAEIAWSIKSEWERLGEPVVVTACTACQKNLSRVCPEIATVSLYRYMEEHPEHLPAVMTEGKEAVCVFDPCGSAGDEALKDAVRTLTARYGYELTTDNKEHGCCGFGGHIYQANQKLFDSIVQEQIDQNEHEMIVYCANCRDVFASRGKECRHILDVIFGLSDANRKPPSLSERRRNRRLLKAYYTGEDVMEYQPKIPIMISEELQKQMDRLLVLNEEVYETIETAEESGIKVYDRENDQFYAHKVIGNVTVWVVYSVKDGIIVLNDVYRHRVKIKEK